MAAAALLRTQAYRTAQEACRNYSPAAEVVALPSPVAAEDRPSPVAVVVALRLVQEAGVAAPPRLHCRLGGRQRRRHHRRHRSYRHLSSRQWQP